MGITTRKATDGTPRYDVRVRHAGKVFFEGGFRTKDAAKEALARLSREAMAAKYLPAVEVRAPYDPTIADLLGDPDNPDKPGAGTYLEWMGRTGAKVAPSYLRRLRTAIRALLPFWGTRRASEVNGDTLVAYQRHRQSAAVQTGAKIHAAAVARRQVPAAPATRRRRIVAAVKQGPTIGPACINREVMALRGALTWAADATRDSSRRIVPVAWPKGIMLEEPPPANKVLLPEADDRLREVRPEWLRDLAILLRATGMRPGEGLALTWQAVDLDAGALVVLKSKTRLQRPVAIPADALAMLQARRTARDADVAARLERGEPAGPGADLVFCTSTGGALTSSKAASIWHREAERLDLRSEEGLRPTLHSLRHTLATRVQERGYTDSEIAALLGHSRTAAVTRRYLHSGMARLREMVESAAPNGRPTLRKVQGGEGDAG